MLDMEAGSRVLKNIPFKRLTSTDSNASVTSNASRSSTNQKNTRYDSQFFKTKLCMFWQNGRCTRKYCKYAHGEDELNRTPDLRKTAMCRTLLTQGSCEQEDCSFAHSLDELRATDKFFKTTMCCFNRYGTCKLGDQCRHAHNRSELRSNGTRAEKHPTSESTASPVDSYGDIDWASDEFGDLKWERAQTTPAALGCAPPPSLPIGVGNGSPVAGQPARHGWKAAQESDSDPDDAWAAADANWGRMQTMPAMNKPFEGRPLCNPSGRYPYQHQPQAALSPAQAIFQEAGTRPLVAPRCVPPPPMRPRADCSAVQMPMPCSAAQPTGPNLMQLPFAPPSPVGGGIGPAGMMLVQTSPAQQVSCNVQEVQQTPFLPLPMAFRDLNPMVGQVRHSPPAVNVDTPQMMQHPVWGAIPMPVVPGGAVTAHSQALFNQLQARLLEAAMPDVYED